jgi:hypothetical protein
LIPSSCCFAAPVFACAVGSGWYDKALALRSTVCRLSSTYRLSVVTSWFHPLVRALVKFSAFRLAILSSVCWFPTVDSFLQQFRVYVFSCRFARFARIWRITRIPCTWLDPLTPCVVYATRKLGSLRSADLRVCFQPHRSSAVHSSRVSPLLWQVSPKAVSVNVRDSEVRLQYEFAATDCNSLKVVFCLVFVPIPSFFRSVCPDLEPVEVQDSPAFGCEFRRSDH